MRKELIYSRNQSQEETITSAEQHDLIDDIHRGIDLFDEKSLEKIIEAWAEKQSVDLPHAVLCEALEFASSVGNRKLFGKLLALIKTNSSEFYASNLIYFDGIDLELEWKTSTNTDDLLQKFEEFYKKSIANDKNTKLIMRFCSVIIEDCVEKRGESAVIKLKDKIENLCQTSGDYRLLFELWRRLFER